MDLLNVIKINSELFVIGAIQLGKELVVCSVTWKSFFFFFVQVFVRACLLEVLSSQKW